MRRSLVRLFVMFLLLCVAISLAGLSVVAWLGLYKRLEMSLPWSHVAIACVVLLVSLGEVVGLLHKRWWPASTEEQS